MQWDDINDDGVWTIPSEKREKSNAGSLQLPQVVLDIINGQPNLLAMNMCSLPARAMVRSTVSANAKKKSMKKFPCRIGPFTICAGQRRP